MMQLVERAKEGAAAEVLTFKLGEEEYGIDVLQVQEIRGFETPTHIANAPAHMLGVLNLRGTIIPVFDLRKQFNIGEPLYTDTTAVIITHGTEKQAGLVVDSVVDVLTLTPECLNPVPEIAALGIQQHITGIATPDADRLLVLLDASNFSETA